MVTVTLFAPGCVKRWVEKFAVIVVGFTTITAVTVTPPETVTLAPVTKLPPVRVTGTGGPPRACEAGEIELKVGGGGLCTVKLTALVVIPPVVTVTLRAPVAAPVAMVNVAVMVVASTTFTLPTVTPEPLTLSVDPRVEKLVPAQRHVDIAAAQADVGSARSSVSVGVPTDVPARDTCDPPIVALPVSVSEPSIVPAAGVGELNTTVIVQLAPAANVALVVQVPPAAPQRDG